MGVLLQLLQFHLYYTLRIVAAFILYLRSKNASIKSNQMIWADTEKIGKK